MNSMADVHAALMQQLAKAIDTAGAAPIVPQDLEIEAHNTLWSETDPAQLTALKLLPSTPATQVQHEYALITSYNTQLRRSGFFGEKSLPPEGTWQMRRIRETVKLAGNVMPVFLLAALEKTISAMGGVGADEITRKLQRLDFLFQKNQDIYFSDTTCIRQGRSGVRARGLIQQIREGTDGSGTDTDGNAIPESPFGSHVIDMEGQPLTLQTLRTKNADIMVLFGAANLLIMDPYVRASFEASMDGDRVVPMPFPMAPFKIGQNVGGLVTNGNHLYFETDVGLTPYLSKRRYNNTLMDAAPRTRPTVSGSVGSFSESKFYSADAGDFYWVITETKDGVEGLGTRWPATGTQAVAAGERVTFTITGGDPTADSFCIYRGTSADAADTDAWFLEEVANTSTGAAKTAYDYNQNRPNTGTAFMLNVRTPLVERLHTEGGYDHIRANSTEYLTKQDTVRNTVAIAHLGPQLGEFELAKILAQSTRTLQYSAYTPIVRNPRQNIVFINVGSNS